MAKYIELEEAVKTAMTLFAPVNTATQEVIESSLRSKFNILPAADVAPVVRCEYCEYREKSADLTHTIYCKWLDLPMPKDAFCSYGKRKAL